MDLQQLDVANGQRQIVAQQVYHLARGTRAAAPCLTGLSLVYPRRLGAAARPQFRNTPFTIRSETARNRLGKPPPRATGGSLRDAA